MPGGRLKPGDSALISQLGRFVSDQLRLATGFGTPPETKAARGYWVADSGDRVAAPEHRADPHDENAELALPGRDRQYVVAAVHDPGRESLDDDSPVLEDPAPEAESRHRSPAVVDVLLGQLPTKRGRDVGGEELSLTHGVLSVGHGPCARVLRGEVGNRGVVAGGPGIRNVFLIGSDAQVGANADQTPFVDRQIGVLGRPSGSPRYPSPR